MLGAKTVAQGRRGTGDDKTPIGIRCPPDIYEWLSASRLPRETDTGMILRALEQLKDLEEAAGPRMAELRAAAVLEGTTQGQMIARLALEALDHKRRGRK